AGVDPREMLGDLGRCLRLGCGLRDRRRVGPVAGVDHQQAACCPLEASGSLCHFPPADDTVPLPASRRLPPGPPRVCGPATPRAAGPPPPPPGAPPTGARPT